MDLNEVKKIAQERGVQNPSENKTELICQIQIKEGYSPCFSTEKRNGCDQLQCLWRSDCVAPGTAPAATAPSVAPKPAPAPKECCKPAAAPVPPVIQKPASPSAGSQSRKQRRK